MNKNNLPNNLYELRRSAGLSQEEFAERLGVSRQAVSKWERGEAYPDTENLITISEMFGVTIDELLSGDELVATVDEIRSKTATQDEAQDNASVKHGIGVGIPLKLDDRVCLHEGSGAGEDFNIDDKDNVEDKIRKNSKLSIWYKVPYPIVTTIAFLAIGMLSEGWNWAWTLFITIPIYYSLLDSIRLKRCTEFAYPVLMAFLYCLFGMLFSWWHPGWLIFVTIPAYYPIAEAIDRYNKDKRR